MLTKKIHRCVICLIRGQHGLCPCPRCLIPKEDLAEHKIGKLRTARDALAILKQVDEAPTKAIKEEIVKEFGLRPLFVCIF